MSFTIRLDSPASPEQVLAALREDTREWREAALPPELRRHARRVAVRIRGEAFTLSYEYRGEVGPDVVLRGAVRPGDAGGTRVIAAAGLARGEAAGPLVLLAGGLAGWLSGGGAGWLLLPAAAGAWAALNERRVAALTREGSVEARHLAERLEAAVAAAGRRAAPGRPEPAV